MRRKPCLSLAVSALKPPYSEERRQKASQCALQNGFNDKSK